MRQGTLSLSFATLLIAMPLYAEEVSTPAPTPSEAVTSPVAEQMEEPLQPPADNTSEQQASSVERASAQIVRLRQENQRLKLQLKEAQAEQLPPLLSERQTWFLIGGGVVFLSLIVGSLLRGNRRSRREWLN